MSTARALAELERSPELFEHIAHLQRVAEDELRRREQFYCEINPATLAEFINGQIVMPAPESPVHTQTILRIARLLEGFAGPRGLGTVYPAGCLVRCRRNDYVPDVCFFHAARHAALPEHPGVFPPPDLAVEVLSPTSEPNDRGLKLAEYARHGVGEYWLVDADHGLVEQYVALAGDREYRLRARLPVGARLTSTVLAGLEIPVAAIFDAAENQRVLPILHVL